MSYTPTTWVNDTTPALSAANLNKLTDELESQAAAKSVSHSLPNWADGTTPALTDAAPLNEMERVLAAVASACGLGYTPTIWQAGWTPSRNASRLNRMEAQAVSNRTVIDSPPGAGPSGIAMPSGNVTSGGYTWRPIFSDDFTNWTCSLGQWTSGSNGAPTINANWGAYPYPWTYNPGFDVNGNTGLGSVAANLSRYWPEKTFSVNVANRGGDSASALHCLDYWHHYDAGSGYYLACTPFPSSTAVSHPRTNMRIAICFKTDSFANWHSSFLLWPDSNTWPRDGEIDFPEGQYNGKIDGFMHRQNATSGGDQDYWGTGVTQAGSWHVAVQEWVGGVSCQWFLNGTAGPRYTSRVPNTPMHYVIQSGATSKPANTSVEGHVLIDWVVVYEKV